MTCNHIYYPFLLSARSWSASTSRGTWLWSRSRSRLSALRRISRYLTEKLFRCFLGFGLILTSSLAYSFSLCITSLQVFDFQLTDEEMKTILGFNRNWRACPAQWWDVWVEKRPKQIHVYRDMPFQYLNLLFFLRAVGPSIMTVFTWRDQTLSSNFIHSCNVYRRLQDMCSSSSSTLHILWLIGRHIGDAAHQQLLSLHITSPFLKIKVFYFYE